MKLKNLSKSFALTVGVIVVALAVMLAVYGIIQLSVVFGAAVPVVLAFGFFWWLIHNDMKAYGMFK